MHFWCALPLFHGFSVRFLLCSSCSAFVAAVTHLPLLVDCLYVCSHFLYQLALLCYLLVILLCRLCLCEFREFLNWLCDLVNYLANVVLCLCKAGSCVLYKYRQQNRMHPVYYGIYNQNIICSTMLFWRIRSRCEVTSWGSVNDPGANLRTIPENKRRQVRDPRLLVEEYSQVVSYLL